MTEETYANAKGLNIFLRTVRPTGEARAVVAIVHGFNSHSGQYVDVAEQLAARGYVVYALDLHGRGRSDGERFYVDDFADYVDDVKRMVDLAREREAGKKVFLLGHSAGGVTACLYALDHQASLAGLICESFAFKTPAPDFAIAALKGLSHLAPHAHVVKLNNSDFSRDPAVVAALNADKYIANEIQPTRTIAALARADDRLEKSFATITLPVLILHGTADKAAKSSGSQFFFDHAGSKDKTLKLYDGHVHDLLHDVDHEKVMADVLGWLEGHG